jgi:hypothetical protein
MTTQNIKSHIIEKACNTPKIAKNKHEMGVAILELAERLTIDRGLDAEDITTLAAAYQMLSSAESKSKKMTDFGWVALAVADNKDVRPYLQYVYSDGENLVATDGHRIHVLETTDYEQGFYDPKSGEKLSEEDAKYVGQYPDWKRLMWSKKPNPFDAEWHYESVHKTNCRMTQDQKGEPIGFNDKYIKDAEYKTQIIGESDRRLCLQDETGKRRAIVMGMRL